VRIGVMLTVSGVQAGAESSSGSLAGSSWSTCDVLGESLLAHTVASWQASAERVTTVAERPLPARRWFPSRAASAIDLVPDWEQGVSDQLASGIDLLLIARLGPYVELELGEVVAFHREASRDLTQVYDSKGPLDIALINARVLREGSGSFRNRLSSAIPEHRHYMFNGYVNRLKHPADFRRLAQDAFLGRNKLVPVGNEVRPGVWIGSGAVIDPSAVISSPVYIGAETHVQAMCTIAEMSTVERGCMVDCGTLVENSSVLADTYLGMGLTVCNSVVGMGKLFHLERNVEVSIADERLVGKITRSKSLLASARSLFRA
jgi:hypothetical protein